MTGVEDCETTRDPPAVITCRRMTTTVRGAGAGTVVAGAMVEVVGETGGASDVRAESAAMTAARSKVAASAAPPTTRRVAAAA
jgi:hypothetical protein